MSIFRELCVYHNKSWNGNSGYDLRNNTAPAFRPGEYSTPMYGNLTLNVIKNYVANLKTNPNTNPFFIYAPFQAIHGPLQAPQWAIDYFNDTIEPGSCRNTLAGMAYYCKC